MHQHKYKINNNQVVQMVMHFVHHEVVSMYHFREDMDFEDDLKKWEADLTEEHEWVKEEVLTKFNNEYSLYLHQLELWKDQKMRIVGIQYMFECNAIAINSIFFKRSAKKRIAIRKKRSTNHSDFEDSEVEYKVNFKDNFYSNFFFLLAIFIVSSCEGQ